ncbi:MAG: hypothetical protein CVV52_07290 [Spirochaetae bacterium HGW-Spirochaetae-8]|nr:MAG: hypothetical protein CVV52_07290 [Spirochaetae bacterium HGW-Spirochaetae-8]
MSHIIPKAFRPRVFLTRALAVLVLMAIALPCAHAANPRPNDAEVKVAIQSILVAAAATVAAQGLNPPLLFAESTYLADPFYTDVKLTMQKADVGHLRQVVLDSPAPDIPQPTGFLSSLLRSAVPLIPEHAKLIAYLRPQGLKQGEVVLSGAAGAVRTATTYPFRYEGSGDLLVSGSRFSQAFQLQFSFQMPLEGPEASSIIPVTVLANGYDYIHVALALFPPPAAK